MKIGIIIQREYLTRVKKRSFIILTILAPLFFAALMFIPALLATNSDKFDKKRTIAVCDETTMFRGKFESTELNNFVTESRDIEELKKMVREEIYDAVLYIPATTLNIPVNAELISTSQLSMSLTSYIKTTMKQVVEHQKLLASGIDPAIVKASTANINIQSIRLNEDDGTEKKSYSEFEYILGIILSLITYLVIFMFGGQVLRGVIEEKTNRIIEVIISSVKPFELMLGKIIGLALVGLTQFLLWIVLTMAIYGAVSLFLPVPEAFSTGSVMT